MNPAGFLPVKPLPLWVVACGQAVADVVKFTTGMEVPYQEGLMLIVSTIVMIVSIVIWIVIDAGNRADKQAHQAVLDARLHPRPTNATSRRSLDLERLTELARAAAAAANGRDGGGSTSGDLAGDGGAAYSSTGGGSGGSAYTEKLYFREGAGGGSLRKRMQQL
ncbi:hypothetical protein CHLRE_13g568000v5 [Chlamydomonas reinhardtii]|uniref:Uncharacterized protein n=1 Tax=Chlamydomonas reinhardtii TaxID=3055 RepID=A8HS16_CHLRE|nr:uncharacterized protein CHLRE_13g568000v5 [Chlamydomonas reinhardtii]PNW73671.1 hypothetical protein CHLRE_13g568000v5 [Chlamydomonas reinhardtii]|eukprot:XP_001693448.1 predicted protein [Chlamydomonas reinhardtii]